MALQTRPVAVLSNNDGCIVALTDEVKAIEGGKIKRGMPLFQCRDVLERYSVQLFSSNYSL